jgi:hypothetical protein
MMFEISTSTAGHETQSLFIASVNETDLPANQTPLTLRNTRCHALSIETSDNRPSPTKFSIIDPPHLTMIKPSVFYQGHLFQTPCTWAEIVVQFNEAVPIFGLSQELHHERLHRPDLLIIYRGHRAALHMT